MSDQEVREILSAFRPEIDDGADPRIAEALRRAQDDPVLRVWYEEHRAADRILRERFQQIPVPDDLRERILSATPPRRAKRSWRLPWLVPPLAATVATLAAIGLWFTMDQPSDFSAYREEMVEFVSDEYELTSEASELSALRSVFASAGWPADYEVPAKLTSLPVEGGTALKWKDHPVSLVCLEHEEHGDFWMFVIERSALPDEPEAEAPRYLGVGRMMTASWSQGSNTYVLVAEVDEAMLRRYR